MRHKNQRRSGHADLQFFCGSLLLSLCVLFLLLTRTNLKPILKSLDDSWLNLALLAIWGACFFASIGFIALVGWLRAKWPRPK